MTRRHLEASKRPLDGFPQTSIGPIVRRQAATLEETQTGVQPV